MMKYHFVICPIKPSKYSSYFQSKKIWTIIIIDDYNHYFRDAVTVQCDMNFHVYPFDAQKCAIQIRSCKCEIEAKNFVLF